MVAATTEAPTPVVLLVADEAALLRYNLEKSGFLVEQATGSEQAMARAAESTPDLVLLDGMLPAESGIEICRQLRRCLATRALPVIMLTAGTEEEWAVRGLDAGADSCIAKPFSVDALVARIRALLRRSPALPARAALRFHDCTLDLTRHRIRRNGRPVHLRPTEFRLLEFLMRHPRRVFSRNDLLDAVWGADVHVEARTVDVHIRRLRCAINGDGERNVVRTVRAAGYALDIEPA